jgi:uncharacterized cupredoxin-like copper-binding protein
MSVLTRSAASLALRVFEMSLAAAAWSGCRHASAAVPELSIVSDEYGYRMPDSIPAGLVHITLHNAGKDLHEALLVRFTDTIGTATAYADSVRAHVDFPSNAEDVGGAALTMPGDSSGVWLRLEPGRYAIVCWKGDHLTRGMVHDLRVVATERAPGNPPTPTRQLTLADFAFTLDTPFTAGHHVIHVRNNGTEAHEADIIKATPTAGLREYLAWIDSGSNGLPPAAPVAGFGDIYPGKEAWVAVHLTPGRYFMLCEVQAKADGRPHFKHGMFAEFTVR